MTFRRARIFGIELGVGNAVKAHGAVTGSHHAKDNQNDNAGGFKSTHVMETVRGHPHGTKRKGHRKQRMAKPNKMRKFEKFIHF